MQLASLVITQSAQITHLQHQIIVLEAEVETLRKGPPVGSGKVVPAFVKANKPTLEANCSYVGGRVVFTNLYTHNVKKRFQVYFESLLL